MNLPSAYFPDKKRLDLLYGFYNSRQWVHPDPLEYLYDYPAVQDREVVGLIASSLAYGRVAQILKSISSVLEKMGPSPCEFIRATTPQSLGEAFKGFKHRWTTGQEMQWMLVGVKHVIDRYGSIKACFLSGLSESDENVLPALNFLVAQLRRPVTANRNSLLPSPGKGSACKRLNLFLRWMIREDRVDPGGWGEVSPGKLIVPLDTHMHRIALRFNLTRRRLADLRTALEVTRAFRKISPGDPVRYDFALTRLGIRGDEGVPGMDAGPEGL